MKPHIRKLSKCWMAHGNGMIAYGPTPSAAYDKLAQFWRERVERQQQSAAYNAMVARLRISGMTRSLP